MSNKNNHYDAQLDKTSQTTRYFKSIPVKTLQALTKHQKDILVISDLAGNVVFVSDSIKRMLGYEQEQYFGKRWKLTVSEETEKYIAANINNNGDDHFFTFNYRHANGRQMLIKCIVDKIDLEENNEEYYVLTLEDITGKKEIEELMLRAEKMSITGQLAAGIAHEIRNPLTAIKGFLQLLQSGIGDAEAYFRVMVDEIEKIDEITSELLFLSKPVTESFKHYVIFDMVADIVMLFQPQATKKDIQIVNNVDNALTLYCDHTQMKQLFINLIKNALEEMNAKGSIFINSTVVDDHIQLDIVDEGPGIHEEIIQKIEEPFFTTKPEGTGLGLVITKQIIERHHGQLHVFRNETIGSTFRIQLPKKN
ncbi:MAG TPA: ATP-binding protein [Bacillota bacterium]|nr:ATP-binding protein [Bacillota bacterium]